MINRQEIIRLISEADETALLVLFEAASSGLEYQMALRGIDEDSWDFNIYREATNLVYEIVD